MIPRRRFGVALGWTLGWCIVGPVAAGESIHIIAPWSW